MQVFSITKPNNASKIILWDLYEQNVQSTIEKANIVYMNTIYYTISCLQNLEELYSSTADDEEM